MLTSANGWTAASVGAHWTRGPYLVSTVRQGTRSGYNVYRQGICLGEFLPLDRVPYFTDRRLQIRRADDRRRRQT